MTEAIYPSAVNEFGKMRDFLITHLNGELILAKHLMKTPSGTWHVVFFHTGVYSHVQHVFKEVVDNFEGAGWDVAKIVDIEVDGFFHKDSRVNVPEPIVMLLKEQFTIDATRNLSFFQQRSFALLLLEKN